MSSLDKTKLLLLGEIHGVKENVDIVYTLFKRFKFKRLALEWNEELKEQVEKFLETNEIDFETIQNSPDGRITAGHFALFKKLKDEGLLDTLICFDKKSSNGWNERDADMAKNVLTNLSDDITLVVAGNLHTKVTHATSGDEEENYSMGEHIKRQIPSVPSVEIKYLSGQYYNCGARDFGEKPQRVEPRALFYRSDDGTYVFELPEAHAATVPNPDKISHSEVTNN